MNDCCTCQTPMTNLAGRCARCGKGVGSISVSDAAPLERIPGLTINETLARRRQEWLRLNY